ncbi:MAG: cell envelope integrity EipB family protein [Rhodospirillales bacterium]|nr:cell envelope integrity EipB family protein [Rhodospirillales bacterium]
MIKLSPDRYIYLLIAFIAVLAFIDLKGSPAGKEPPAPQPMTEALVSRDSAVKPAQIIDGLAAHKALYEIEMTARRSSAQILNISGQMFFEWRPVCEAWTSDHQFNLTYEYAETAPMHITSDFSTYEAFDGESFNFSSRRSRNGDIYEELRGRAESPPGKEGTVSYTIPANFSLDLPPGTLFPVSHTMALIAQARKGKKFFNATVFDGSDEDGPVEINAFIGKELSPEEKIKDRANVDQTFLDTRAWHVRMAFFPLAEPAADSDYEMDVVLYENGVIGDMLVEYKDFSVTQKLVALEKPKTSPCH